MFPVQQLVWPVFLILTVSVYTAESLCAYCCVCVYIYMSFFHNVFKSFVHLKCVLTFILYGGVDYTYVIALCESQGDNCQESIFFHHVGFGN